MSTMRFADEVVPRSDVDGVPDRRTKPDTKMLRMATQLVDSLTSDWNPKRYHDTFTEELAPLPRGGGAHLGVVLGQMGLDPFDVVLREVDAACYYARRPTGIRRSASAGRGGGASPATLAGQPWAA